MATDLDIMKSALRRFTSGKWEDSGDRWRFWEWPAIETPPALWMSSNFAA